MELIGYISKGNPKKTFEGRLLSGGELMNRTFSSMRRV